MPQKKLKFNIIDVIAVVLVLAVVLFAVFKLLSGRADEEEPSGDIVPITYQVLVENQPAEMLEAVQKYIPSQIMASSKLYDGEITAVEAKPSVVCSGGEWVEDPDHVDLTFTVTAKVEKADVLEPSVGLQEIRVGKRIILKTEYIEFEPAYVVNVEYTG